MTTILNRRPIFDMVRTLLGRSFTHCEVERLDRAIDRAFGTEPRAEKRHLGHAGMALLKRFEGCAKLRDDGLVEAYPDPGSADGLPWTIGWGSTGPDISKGTVWTRQQCDERFALDLKRYAGEVVTALDGAPTTQNQFDALISFQYNTGAIARATLTALHRRGEYDRAAREFGKWIFNDGTPMRGLKNRRAAEARLYASA